MSAASLPYTVLILLLELAVGSLAFATIFDARRQVTPGYIKAGAITIVPLALLAAWTYISLAEVDVVDGYAINREWIVPLGVALAGFIVIAVAHLIAAMRERRQLEVRLGAAGTAVGAVALVALAGVVALPAWSYVGVVASVLIAAAVLGGSLMAMMWGHWYLTSGRLPKEPMEQMSLLVLGALVLQAVLVIVGALAPARAAPPAEGAFGVALGENLAFWLRVGVGVLFPIVLAWLAWRAARIRGMMSATGLLYIALGAVLAGEVLARGLLFSTGAAV